MNQREEGIDDLMEMLFPKLKEHKKEKASEDLPQQPPIKLEESLRQIPLEQPTENIPKVHGVRKCFTERRAIEDVPPWIGWGGMLAYYKRCPSPLRCNIFVTLFETGGRVSEVVQLKPDNFIWNEEAIKVEGMIVKKARKRKKRDFLIKRDEQNPLTEDLISFVEHCDTEYLFPRVTRFGVKAISNLPTSTTRIYLKVREISDDLWCHWFRAMRASYNVFVRKMDIFDLQKWFAWTSVDTPAHYINQTLEKQAEQMGIKQIPTRM